MLNNVIKLILIILLIFTPIAFGSVELWAFSLVELGILLIIVLWAIQSFILRTPSFPLRTPNSELRTIHFVFLFLFLFLVLIQMIPLPSGIVKIISPNTYALRHSLTFDLSPLTSSYTFEPSALNFQLSFVPFATRIEFFKWLTLSGFFFFLLHWRNSNRDVIRLILIIMLVGIAESLYGMLEFFSGHGYILHLDMQASAVTGTFINRNYLQGIS